MEAPAYYPHHFTHSTLPADTRCPQDVDSQWVIDVRPNYPTSPLQFHSTSPKRLDSFTHPPSTLECAPDVYPTSPWEHPSLTSVTHLETGTSWPPSYPATFPSTDSDGEQAGYRPRSRPSLADLVFASQHSGADVPSNPVNPDVYPPASAQFASMPPHQPDEQLSAYVYQRARYPASDLSSFPTTSLLDHNPWGPPSSILRNPLSPLPRPSPTHHSVDHTSAYIQHLQLNDLDVQQHPLPSHGSWRDAGSTSALGKPPLMQPAANSPADQRSPGAASPESGSTREPLPPPQQSTPSSRSHNALSPSTRTSTQYSTAPATAGLSDEALARRKLLARNRLAAIKSRKRKRDYEEGMEAESRLLAGRNENLQGLAIALLTEARSLRMRLMQLHNGCSCEDVQNYIARECDDGGVESIAAAAARVLGLDFRKVPLVGSTKDVYEEERHRWGRQEVEDDVAPRPDDLNEGGGG